MAPTSTVVSSATTSEPATTTTTTATPADLPVIAWQPSHQDDTGDDTWHEYVVCGDIVKRTMQLTSGFPQVLAWELEMGLAGSNNNGGTNRRAFDSELGIANGFGADYFVSIHVDRGAPSGVIGMYFSGDRASAEFATALAKRISAGVGLP